MGFTAVDFVVFFSDCPYLFTDRAHADIGVRPLAVIPMIEMKYAAFQEF
jgi:uncharacterized membrane protein